MVISWSCRTTKRSKCRRIRRRSSRSGRERRKLRRISNRTWLKNRTIKTNLILKSTPLLILRSKKSKPLINKLVSLKDRLKTCLSVTVHHANTRRPKKWWRSLRSLLLRNTAHRSRITRTRKRNNLSRFNQRMSQTRNQKGGFLLVFNCKRSTKTFLKPNTIKKNTRVPKFHRLTESDHQRSLISRKISRRTKKRDKISSKL